ncbi:MAG TPA: hypothetical protein VHR67_14060, partial [Aestuariivirgaceae bacterium]|nr:hypothetical protein [Aestuariivirgaceae bacterium]
MASSLDSLDDIIVNHRRESILSRLELALPEIGRRDGHDQRVMHSNSDMRDFQNAQGVQNDHLVRLHGERQNENIREPVGLEIMGILGGADLGLEIGDLLQKFVALILDRASLFVAEQPIGAGRLQLRKDLLTDLGNAAQLTADFLLHFGTRHELQEKTIILAHQRQQVVDGIAKDDRVAVRKRGLMVEQRDQVIRHVLAAFLESFLRGPDRADIGDVVPVPIRA